jgi:hypothetical protein
VLCSPLRLNLLSIRNGKECAGHCPRDLSEMANGAASLEGLGASRGGRLLRFGW